MRRKTQALILVIVLVAAGMQFFQPNRNNPPINPQMTFESTAMLAPQTAGILQRSCYDCHSNATHWPGYSYVAPVSWFIAHDVNEGRKHLNFSEWGSLSREEAKVKLYEICSEVRNDDMPLYLYALMHKKAKLSQQDKSILCNGAR